MNQFLNQNADEIIKEMKPAASQTIARYFREFLKAAFLKIPTPYLWSSYVTLVTGHELVLKDAGRN